MGFYERKVHEVTGLTPIQAIRAKCRDCANHQCKEIRLCAVKNCPLWPYRMGKRPPKPIEVKIVIGR
jgi:hypothetical protein